MKSSHFLSLHLAPASHFACDFSQGACLQAVRVFSFVRNTHTHTPKSICQVLTSSLAPDIGARADKVAQTLVSSKSLLWTSLVTSYDELVL